MLKSLKDSVSAPAHSFVFTLSGRDRLVYVSARRFSTGARACLHGSRRGRNPHAKTLHSRKEENAARQPNHLFSRIQENDHKRKRADSTHGKSAQPDVLEKDVMPSLPKKSRTASAKKSADARVRGQKKQPTNSLPPEIRAYAKLGWQMFPIKPGKEKQPCIKWKAGATSDIAQLEALAAKFPGCNWAVATGERSGILVIDVDGPEGRASLAALEGQHGKCRRRAHMGVAGRREDTTFSSSGQQATTSTTASANSDSTGMCTKRSAKTNLHPT